MTTSSKHRSWATFAAALLVGLSIPAVAHYGQGEAARIVPATGSAQPGYPQWHAGAAGGRMRVGLTLIAEPTESPLPDPASLDFPATSRAIRCESEGQRYRECRTPFRGPVTLAREVSGTRCVEDENWGWREGAVWVDRGCAAVFLRIGEG
ncbi:DUF3011 domain-containing protein [Lysobacter koreensis]|uniref:DUF3011 domain-containing protein n=1 Tax=Lysobacter koreensis TaxID=266122 RepID=A0ABW2YRN1_9GAMM